MPNNLSKKQFLIRALCLYSNKDMSKRLDKRFCIVPHCQSHTGADQNVSFFKVTLKRLEEWRSVIPLTHKKLKYGDLVCVVVNSFSTV